MAQICDALDDRLKLSADRRLALVLAAELHDIGKIGVPEHLLNKAGFLSDAELRRIHEHAAIGAEILGGVDFPRPVADIVAAAPAGYAGICPIVCNRGLTLRGYADLKAGELSVDLDPVATVPLTVTDVTPATGDGVDAIVLGIQMGERLRARIGA